MTLHFGQPLWLPAGLLACLAAALFIRANIARRKKALQKFASPHLLRDLTRNVSPSRRRTKNILLVAALACLFLALARPQYGYRWVEVRQKGIDILIGFDVSKSMLVRDITPNRLERAKLAVRDFVSRLDGDRIGLMPFAGTAFLMCPLTTDYEAFDTSLDALDVNIIPKGGTNIGAAIREAEKVLKNEANHKILILVTDGEDLGKDALDAARRAGEDNMTIYTIGVGTAEGELIPAPADSGKQFIQDENGTFVRSRLDEKTLTEIAQLTGGLYAPLGSMGQGFDTVYEQKLALVPKQEHGERKRKLPIERFAWPLGAAALLLGIDFLITGRKSRWSLRLPFVKTAGRRSSTAPLAAVLLFLLCAHPLPSAASEGEDFFNSGKFDDAIKYYENALRKKPDDPVLQFNLGDAAYRKKDFEQAINAYNQALKSQDLDLQARSYYNRGNAQYFLGKAAEKTDPEHTMKQWQEAVKSFEAALALSPEDKEAAHNLDVVRKKLEQLQKQQQQKDKNQQNNKNRNKENKDKNKKNKEGKNKQKNSQNKKDQNSGDNDKQGQQGDKGEKQDKQSKENSSGSSSRQDNKDKQKSDTDKQKNNKNQDSRPEKEQDSAGKKSKDKQNNGNNAGESDQQARPSEKKSGAGSMNRQDLERRKQGKMTREEARNLLNSLKGEQKELNFIPRGGNIPDNDNRDW
jgi:Ca-activated chloride channel family protein